MRASEYSRERKSRPVGGGQGFGGGGGGVGGEVDLLYYPRAQDLCFLSRVAGPLMEKEKEGGGGGIAESICFV